MTTLALVGWSALLAAVATVVGALTLGLFFSRGEPWGKANDISSIVLMLATIPVALAVAALQAPSAPLNLIAAGVGVVGMLGNAASQALLVVRRASYERLLPWTLASGAIVGAWYLLVGLIGGMPPGFDVLAILAGFGFIGVGIGFWRGGQRDPLAALSFATLLGASTFFLAYLGLFLVSGKLSTPCCE